MYFLKSLNNDLVLTCYTILTIIELTYCALINYKNCIMIYILYTYYVPILVKLFVKNVSRYS